MKKSCTNIEYVIGMGWVCSIWGYIDPDSRECVHCDDYEKENKGTHPGEEPKNNATRAD